VATVSVIIPNTDSLLIGDILRALRAQRTDLSQVEVLVVGTDAPGLVQEDWLVRLIPTERAACASDKRNRGMQEAQGEIFMFLDDDCIPWPDWIARHLNRHRQGERVVGGGVAFAAESYFQLGDNVSGYHGFFLFHPASTRSHLVNANASLHRSVVQQVGMMHPGLNVGDDLDWFARMRRAGYVLYFEPEAIIWHKPARYTLSMVMQRWITNPQHSLGMLLQYPDMLNTPFLARYRWLFLWGAPLIAAWATIRTFAHPRIRALYWHTLPFVYLTKLAWCWGAFKQFPRAQQPSPVAHRKRICTI
jgi:cellulose synthase/poly-beta-1,6-N-acetylglucosamine synthase-like glycosyltransferase